ncbi:hypothetical protein IQ06DRAFT_93123 [Phaeosphaeriaceae sp. SRC1lsM3a]|nr:hypothetical protein IQ06DRAFT_93123 [Stagonospora sp. SRC1lsM3a]
MQLTFRCRVLRSKSCCLLTWCSDTLSGVEYPYPCPRVSERRRPCSEHHTTWHPIQRPVALAFKRSRDMSCPCRVADHHVGKSTTRGATVVAIGGNTGRLEKCIYERERGDQCRWRERCATDADDDQVWDR